MIVKFDGEPKADHESWSDYLHRARLDTYNALKLSAVLFVAVIVAVAVLQGLLALAVG